VSSPSSPPPPVYDHPWMYKFWSQMLAATGGTTVTVTTVPLSTNITSALTIAINTSYLVANNLTIAAAVTVNGAIGVF